MRLHATVLLTTALLLASCGTDREGGAGDPGDRTAYPPGPYGTSVQSVIEDLEFTGLDGEPYSLGDVFADPKNRVLLLLTSAGWCTACIEEQPKLDALHDELSSKGLVILAGFFQDSQYQPAKLTDLERWVAEYEPKYRMVLDAPYVLREYSEGKPTPMNMVVDVDTMTILAITSGYESSIRAVIEHNLDL